MVQLARCMCQVMQPTSWMFEMTTQAYRNSRAYLPIHYAKLLLHTLFLELNQNVKLTIQLTSNLSTPNRSFTLENWIYPLNLVVSLTFHSGHVAQTGRTDTDHSNYVARGTDTMCALTRLWEVIITPTHTHKVIISHFWHCCLVSLQCCDIVGWATARASSL